MKFLSFFFGLVLLGAIIYTGYYTVSHSGFVIWFGVITAILAPIAFEFLLLPFRSKGNQLIKELSKVPQIEKLIKEAEDNEQKVRLLEQQRAELDKLISYEAQRRSLLAEQQIFILQGEAALKGLESVNKSLEELTAEKHLLPESLQPLLLRIEHGETTDTPFMFNGKQYALKKRHFELIPAYGNLAFEIAKLFVQALNKIENPKSK
jgi:hypothetical protein